MAGDGRRSFFSGEPRPALAQFALILAPIVVGCLLWGSYRLSSLLHPRTPPVVRLPSTPSSDQHPGAARVSRAIDDAAAAVLLSRVPFSSVAAIFPTIDPDPVASIPALLTPLSWSSRRHGPVDPSALRK